MAANNISPIGWGEALVVGLTDWSGMAKLVEAFGDPALAALVLLVGMFFIAVVVIVVVVLYYELRASEGRRRERQQRRRMRHERDMATIKSASERKERRDR